MENDNYSLLEKKQQQFFPRNWSLHGMQFAMRTALAWDDYPTSVRDDLRHRETEMELISSTL